MDASSDASEHLAARLKQLRSQCGLTLDGLAERTGVSRSMISVIERNESSPTATVLNKLATGLGVTLASLFADDERVDASPLVRRMDQQTWRDPESGYVRRNLSPPGVATPIELVEVALPSGARVAYDAGPRSVSQQIWLLSGEIELQVGDETYRLATGDCLAMHIDQPTIFHNSTEQDARYLVALAIDSARVLGRPRAEVP